MLNGTWNPACVDRLAAVYEESGSLAAVSAALKRALARLTTREVEVIPNLIDFSNFRLDPDRRDPKKIESVGRLEKIKRQDVLLRAFALARETIPDLELTIVGESRERRALTRLADAVGGRVGLGEVGPVRGRAVIGIRERGTRPAWRCWRRTQAGRAIT